MRSDAQTLQEAGYLDGPTVRYFLRGGRVETWRRDCACKGDCRCWELSGRRPATAEDEEIFAEASRPPPVRPKEAPGVEDIIARLEREFHERAQAKQEWAR